MDYGDPFGLILFWLCYKKEIISGLSFISGFIIAGIITIVYEKKKKKLNNDETTEESSY